MVRATRTLVERLLGSRVRLVALLVARGQVGWLVCLLLSLEHSLHCRCCC